MVRSAAAGIPLSDEIPAQPGRFEASGSSSRNRHGKVVGRLRLGLRVPRCLLRRRETRTTTRARRPSCSSTRAHSPPAPLAPTTLAAGPLARAGRPRRRYEECIALHQPALNERAARRNYRCGPHGCRARSAWLGHKPSLPCPMRKPAFFRIAAPVGPPSFYLLRPWARRLEAE
jgi:hypothetical protein